MREAPSERTTVRRGANRAEYHVLQLLEILDRGLVAHVGVQTPSGPLVLPMAYGRTDSHVFLHGASANALLGQAIGHDVCVTVTIVDGFVVGRSPFHNSMNYRSVVMRGRAEDVTEPDQKRAALRLISDHVVATWATGRPPSDAEIRRTTVLKVPLAEISGKVRVGGPVDEPGDADGPYWGGYIPITATWDAPVGDDGLRPDIEPPPAVAALRGHNTSDP
jgi:nitroimidazol reductase NimA-like FMN-containing flavoprotein (pyridoxamine 5'-phosphate oxidase superfamily)